MDSSDTVLRDNSIMMDIFSHGNNLMVMNGEFLFIEDIKITMKLNNTSPNRKESYLTNTVSVPSPEHMEIEIMLYRLPNNLSEYMYENKDSKIRIFNDKHEIELCSPKIKNVKDNVSNVKLYIVADSYSVEKGWKEDVCELRGVS